MTCMTLIWKKMVLRSGAMEEQTPGLWSREVGSDF